MSARRGTGIGINNFKSAAKRDRMASPFFLSYHLCLAREVEYQNCSIVEILYECRDSALVVECQGR